MDASNSSLELANPISQEHAAILKEEFKDGQITPKGWVNSKGELLPRATNEPRPGLTAEDELVIDQWNKAMQRDFPSVDIAWIDMISTYCYLHPEESKEYALKRMAEASTGVTPFKPENPFQELDDKYMRVHS